MSEPAAIPERGRSPADLLAAIDEMAAGDIDWRGGRAFSLVYNVDDEEHEHLLADVAGRFLHDNALNPFKYPSLLQMELDLIAMACGLFGTAPDAGALTSGGTESIFLAVQVARDHARSQRAIPEPRLVTPTTAHPAFAKAAKYLDVEHVLVPVAADGRADVAATAAAIDDRTGLVVGSAPCYPYGVIDPIGELAALALERGVLFHTDACLGGWLLPWWERLGIPVPAWDFRVPGVTSLSADVHKYGYSFKGASIVAYRSRDLLRHQHFWYDDWPGGLYASGTSAGTRPAPPIAGAWAAVNHLGVDGYMRLTSVVRDTARRIRSAIAGIDGIAVSGDDALGLPIMEIRSDDTGVEMAGVDMAGVDMSGVGDFMDGRGWNLDRQQGGLHLMLSPYHARIADEFVADLADAVANHPRREVTASETAARYGGIAGEVAR
jgi:sphinganine-1-phosphate aldolase